MRGATVVTAAPLSLIPSSSIPLPSEGGHGAYRPFIIPLIRRERPRIEKYYFLRAAKQARKLKADGVIIDDKNNYRIIKYTD